MPLPAEPVVFSHPNGAQSGRTTGTQCAVDTVGQHTVQGNNARTQEKNAGGEPGNRREDTDVRAERENARSVPKWKECFICTVRKCIRVGI